jgi:uncharacterized protein YkwD
MGTHGHHPHAGIRLRRAGAVAAATLLAAALGSSPAVAHSRHHHHRFFAHMASHGCANANTPSLGAPTKTLQRAVVCLINKQRTERGLPALRESWRLDRSAEGWSNRMVATRSFTHGSDFAARISAVGFSWSSVAENIATGYPTPQAVVSAWMASTGHCQNILSPTYHFVGTGISRHGVPPYGTGPSTWTEDFGLPMGSSAPSGNWGPSRGCPD